MTEAIVLLHASDPLRRSLKTHATNPAWNMFEVNDWNTSVDQTIVWFETAPWKNDPTEFQLLEAILKHIQKTLHNRGMDFHHMQALQRIRAQTAVPHL
jgi:hypothetical protein